MIKLNIRWFIQALSLVLSIVAFSKSFELSKHIFVAFSQGTVIQLTLWVALFLFSFFMLMLTSYLKQRGNATLQKPIVFFEKLLRFLKLENYQERTDAADKL